MKKQGLFGLQSPEDLLAKAHRDYERMRAKPMDADAAFDFFVTSRHVPDWLQAAGRGQAADAFAQHVQLRICRHLADGAKHFEATAKQHQQITGTSVSFAVLAPNTWKKGVWKKGTWAEDELVIGLNPADPETEQYGKRIEVGRLAEETLRVLEQLVQEHPPAETPPVQAGPVA
jgi:hypothetical protein